VSEKSPIVWLFYFLILSCLHFMNPGDLSGQPDCRHRAWCFVKSFVTYFVVFVVLKRRRYQQWWLIILRLCYCDALPPAFLYPHRLFPGLV
jgi:hypothetical protein